MFMLLIHGTFVWCINLHHSGFLKEARYKIIQNDRFSWKKNNTQTYRYDDSKYTKIILGYHATFFATCIWKLHEIQFWTPNLYSYMMWLFHVWKPGIYS